MSNASTFVQLIDAAALLSYEHQLHLAEVLGADHSFYFELGASRFEFRCAWGTLECTGVHLLGSAAPGPRSWLWSWANPMGFADELTAAARSVRDAGAERGILELSSAEVPFDAIGLDIEPSAMAWAMMEAAKPLAGRWVGYQLAAEGGTFVAFLLEHPSFELAAPTGPRLSRVVTEGIAAVCPPDEYEAVLSYLTLRGLSVTGSEDTLRFEGADMDGVVEFDEYGQLTDIDVTVGGSG
ncbi:DUF6882 domain-containing protein [Nocardia bovistercoris]|uniref:Uncharacterized protein n=1 Tax=Nocardia bovistercoris TaxID=2785916 RepID=A0A931IG89_9NOCA|nr:DUF6882 domain-containing protein [Nocardia bovistercoris]MBH0780013.1 hypothetical protein [Nocardia bovistercoris]